MCGLWELHLAIVTAVLGNIQCTDTSILYIGKFLSSDQHSLQYTTIRQ
ncbi:BgtTE-56105 [Blumeria graminis f. sp. tritici]|uniref:BgtTE-56105 n=1 Tax=Blumeria graminis f. sp. tritici TaxID=62690 RepID=A0A9X9MM43_BLUGR|nr:BgtTE-56105 [Blumeria graminis f. sp. tritici]